MNVHISSNSSASQRLRWAFFGRSRSRIGEGAAAFFTRFAILIRATPVSQAMLRYELRFTSRASTYAYCAALRTAAGTNKPW